MKPYFLALLIALPSAAWAERTIVIQRNSQTYRTPGNDRATADQYMDSIREREIKRHMPDDSLDAEQVQEVIEKNNKKLMGDIEKSQKSANKALLKEIRKDTRASVVEGEEAEDASDEETTAETVEKPAGGDANFGSVGGIGAVGGIGNVGYSAKP